MKLTKPVAVGAFAVVAVSAVALALAIALSLSKAKRHPIHAEDAPHSHGAHAEPAATSAPSAAGAGASTRPAGTRPAPVTPLLRAKHQAADRRHHLVALFYDPDAPESRTARTRVAEAVEAKYKDRMEVFEVSVAEAENKPTLERLSIFRTPLALVFSPSGAVTQHFREFEDGGAALGKAILSPRMEDVLAGLQERKVVFIHVWKSEGSAYRQNRAELEGLTRLLSTSVHAVYVQADAPEERHLLRDVVQLDPAKDAPVTVVVAKSGAIVEKIPGELTRELLLKAFRKVLVYRSGCGGMGSGPGGGTCQ